MPTVSPTQSESIKRFLFRTREHLGCLGASPDPGLADRLQLIADATFEFNRAMNLPSVKHTVDPPNAAVSRDDAVANLSTVIDVPLSEVKVPSDAAEEAVTAAQEIWLAVQIIALPLPTAS
jgi:hypothetical protein